MKYPSCILAGKGARGETLSMALASADQHQDTGAKMIRRRLTLALRWSVNRLAKMVVEPVIVAKVYVGPKAEQVRTPLFATRSCSMSTRARHLSHRYCFQQQWRFNTKRQFPRLAMSNCSI